MTKTTKALLNRVAIKMLAGMEMKEAIESVRADDRRIVKEVLNLPRETRREFANFLAVDVYAAARAA